MQKDFVFPENFLCQFHQAIDSMIQSPSSFFNTELAHGLKHVTNKIESVGNE